jgi:hypothetical protein
MKQTLTEHYMVNQLIADTYANWSWEGAHKVIQHLLEIERDSGDEIEFDREAIRCDFHEYSTLEELVGDYPDLADKEEYEILEWLQDEGMLIGETSEGVVVRNQ